MTEPTKEQIIADVHAMIAALERDNMYGPYHMLMSLDTLRRVNPGLAAAIEAAGPDVPFEILLDDDGYPCGWRRA